MTAATTQLQVIHGATGSPTRTTAEGGVLWNRTDDEASAIASRIPVPPTAPASNYANYKCLQLAIVVAGDTTITDIGIRKSGVEPSGSRLFYQSPATYAQCTGNGATPGNRPADDASALAASPHPNTPAGWVLLPTTNATILSGPFNASIVGPLGNPCAVLCGVSSSYAGGPDAAAPQSSVIFQYSEA